MNVFKNLGGIGKLEWVGDGYCDDMNNNEFCDFDDRDCCGLHVNKKYCVECKCLSKFLTICKCWRTQSLSKVT